MVANCHPVIVFYAVQWPRQSLIDYGWSSIGTLPLFNGLEKYVFHGCMETRDSDFRSDSCDVSVFSFKNKEKKRRLCDEYSSSKPEKKTHLESLLMLVSLKDMHEWFWTGCSK